ncbi:MAG TPA: sugar phosphate nucleotidyltransferase [Steroidobacteraceae bacterium]|jgi:mannose-1-phosphate guanylyltransferase|nr:sugar phosphate nucleotidyltransferase [Steroidobacteraceae bacterium]
MNKKQFGTWSIVLAAGDGKRLRELTTTQTGDTIPKQYCSLNRSECLLELALQRAWSISSAERVCTIVAAKHRQWWRTLLRQVPPANVIVQPRNRGTAVGIALSLLHLENKDPEGRVVLLPADHYVRDEGSLATSLDDLACHAAQEPRTIFLLGAEPESADCDLGYMVPVDNNSGLRRVKAFVEKPTREQAHSLIGAGALWNMFIVAGSITSLLGLMEESYNFVAPMRSALHHSSHLGALQRLYGDLPTVDFSHDVLSHYPERLKMLTAPECGWTDIGTPDRVVATLKEAAGPCQRETATPGAMYLDLATAVGAR